MTLHLNSPDVIAETVAGEALIINLATGAYFSAQGTAEAIWRRLLDGHDRDAIIAELSSVYDATLTEIGAAIDSFTDQLLAEGLVIERAGSLSPVAGGPDPIAMPGRQPFATPALAKYTDLQELLLLDPIHDVEEKVGWPGVRRQD